MQPTVAIVLGIRSGIKDTREGAAPFLWALAFHGKRRRELLRSAFASIRDLVAIAILLDVISQVLIFHGGSSRRSLAGWAVADHVALCSSPGPKQSDFAQKRSHRVVSQILKRLEMKWFASGVHEFWLE